MKNQICNSEHLMNFFKIFFFIFLITLSIPLQGTLSPLAEAAKIGDLALVKTLVQKGDVDINKKDTLYWMPLHFAIMFGHINIVKFLIENGADVNITSCWGWTPLHVATANTKIEAAKILIQHGANLYKKSDEGRTPLDCLSQELRVKFLRYSNN